MSVPYAIIDRNGMVAAIVPERIVGEVMTSALVPNMGYRMECRPATEDEIYRLLCQLGGKPPAYTGTHHALLNCGGCRPTSGAYRNIPS